MKLNIDGCREFIKEKGIKNYVQLAEALDLGVEVIKLLEQGVRIGYDVVRDIYNKHGEKVVKKIIDFEEDSLDGFKAKYVLVGKTLY
ncbi:MAG: hypothetical protein LUD27_04755 [Clostridia bacterium]|nr:hypothetical protein [Clostridia bacterium]